ncbi:hypothetical protein AB205_0009890 [Aquarana catesbeiana]|uniref:Uncharacterized protein n=1 Tax=Aquarana catesbeiana TaxID=8400 RepID=A0A2G9RA21_AQUCT|nr:hypothetical protein AB205_0009890 [Aquarana catesbeiana]
MLDCSFHPLYIKKKKKIFCKFTYNHKTSIVLFLMPRRGPAFECFRPYLFYLNITPLVYTVS